MLNLFGQFQEHLFLHADLLDSLVYLLKLVWLVRLSAIALTWVLVSRWRRYCIWRQRFGRTWIWLVQVLPNKTVYALNAFFGYFKQGFGIKVDVDIFKADLQGSGVLVSFLPPLELRTPVDYFEDFLAYFLMLVTRTRRSLAGGWFVLLVHKIHVVANVHWLSSLQVSTGVQHILPLLQALVRLPPHGNLLISKGI